MARVRGTSPEPSGLHARLEPATDDVGTGRAASYSSRAVSSRSAPGRDVRPAAQQRPALTLGHAAPHAELDAVVEGVGQALGADRAAHADGLRAVLRGTLDEQRVRVCPPACGPGRPFVRSNPCAGRYGSRPLVRQARMVQPKWPGWTIDIRAKSGLESTPAGADRPAPEPSHRPAPPAAGAAGRRVAATYPVVPWRPLGPRTVRGGWRGFCSPSRSACVAGVLVAGLVAAAGRRGLVGRARRASQASSTCPSVLSPAAAAAADRASWPPTASCSRRSTPRTASSCRSRRSARCMRRPSSPSRTPGSTSTAASTCAALARALVNNAQAGASPGRLDADPAVRQAGAARDRRPPTRTAGRGATAHDA